ncbi:MAG: right-handed parallel beta-helix repeat-containing protein, partial [Lachnospiraceae bacterium]|nr:right-handed parallel beta-helix repeat-containing protein [Lachnospiraceae bacterium]
EDYTFIGYANADGEMTLTDRATRNVISEKIRVTANEYFTADIKLSKGVNGIIMTFTPDPDFKPAGEFSALTDYSTMTATHEVDYRYIGGTVIYASPSGNSNGKGTKESPYDIAYALTHAHAGQTIYLMGGTYALDTKITVGRGQSGKLGALIYVLPDPESDERPVLDFLEKGAGLTIGGDYWYVGGFDVTRSTGKGVQISGDFCTVDGVNSYFNQNTGIQIARLSSSDSKYEDWPHDNLILNCTAYGNADPGYEDADGFACKLTTGDNNVFDGCVAYCNADDGWDMYAKVETGAIGAVTIRNCVAFQNGFLTDGTNAGNGNGFKMGGSSITGYHRLINSVSYCNKAKGIDSNSCPDIQVENCVAYNNGSYNVAFYTNDSSNTDFYAENLVSYKDNNGDGDNIKPKGNQDESKIYKSTNYFWPNGNTEGVKADGSWFKSLDHTELAVTRNADGTINMNDLLVMSDAAPAGVGAFVGGTPSIDFKTVRVNIPDPEPTATPAPTATPEASGNTENVTTPAATQTAEVTPEISGNSATAAPTPGTGDNPAGTRDNVNAAIAVSAGVIVLVVVIATAFFILRKKFRK